MAAILERHGHRVSLLTAARVGYVVHEDQFQVIAEPFADTPVLVTTASRAEARLPAPTGR